LYQNPYVLCRLFKKNDESLEVSNCGEVEQATSAPLAANYSPEEIQSDQAPITASTSQVTEEDKQLPFIPDVSEETISNVITSVDCHSDGYDAHDAQNQIVKLAAEEDQASILDMYYNPKDGLLLDDRLFSPVLAHMPQEFNYQANNESDGQCGLQYGTNEINISDFLNYNLNWDQLPCAEFSSHQQNFSLFNVKDNGSGSESEAGSNMTCMQAAYPQEAIDRRFPFATTPSISTFDHSGDDQKSNVVPLQNNFQTSYSSDVNFGEVCNVVNGYDQPSNRIHMQGNAQSGYNNTVMPAESGIIRRARPARDEQFKTNHMQGNAQRRIRLKVEHVANGNTQEQHNSKPSIAVEKKAAENHAADAESATRTNHASKQRKASKSIDNRKISQKVANGGGLRDFLSVGRVPFRSKTSSNRVALWSSVFVVSASVLVSLVAFTNIWEYIKF
jgi:hypothetical protein